MDIVINDSSITCLNVIDYLDISEGDILVVSSDITRLFFDSANILGKYPSPDAFIDSIIKKVGEEGTILFPVFNWNFCKGEMFDYKKTKGKTGSLGNAALKRADFRRTQHPLYSYMVWGKMTSYFCSKTNENSFGYGSIFDDFDKLNVKFLLIDINLGQGFTFVHHLEQIGPVPFRFNKEFTALYKDEKDDITKRTYSMFVRDYSMDPSQQMEPIEKDFLEMGIIKRYNINGITYMLVSAKDTKDPILQDIRFNNSRKLYKYKGQNE